MATASPSDRKVADDKEKFTFFYRTGSPFSQFHPATFTVDEVEFTCAEQFMMYNKAGMLGALGCNFHEYTPLWITRL